VSTGVPSRQRANAGLDQNPVTSSIIFREGAPSRDPQVLIIARLVGQTEGGGIDLYTQSTPTGMA
ncbi:hypothetical protein, partial [Nocardia farcinica]|uniref:hypothetical protein n=1 Tax=Nocardia farcinica TaxID=37329 RepID=UPI001E400A70